ncbi:helix-turn-helix transcriptional regulator [Streptomyces sp. NPDC096323]|uniref:helix-turn-helix transcriptional regulator n=1 Tax=Streptomyces sp. NPDC096323 TaxID=3155822 RepID=UPI00331A4958
MTARPVHTHVDRDLCDVAVSLYAEALARGSLARSAVEPAPCLIDTALLRPDPHDGRLLRPVPPGAALAHLLHPLAQGLLRQARDADLLAKALIPLTSLERPPRLAIDVIVGPLAIQAAISRSLCETDGEILMIQPGSTRPAEELHVALAGTLPTVERGVRLRHIYQHSARYSSALKAYMGQLPDSLLQVRTLERAVDRLLIFDRKIAYVPATPDRSVALEIRHPALVGFLAGMYETLWAQATPFNQQLPTTLPGTPVTAVQHSIARLLTEGNQDEAVARKLGISVRTCRTHIAKLMQTLEATSRTHLGALLAQSGITEPVPPGAPTGPAPPGTTQKPATPDVPG